MAKFRKKPVEEIEAIQFKGNDTECIAFCPIAIDPEETFPSLIIPTLKGNMRTSMFDWIIKDVNGEFTTMKPKIFKKTYEEVE